ncbi:MAG: RNB domain-containing ribonuclease, partial [Chloroflexota bacterium]
MNINSLVLYKNKPARVLTAGDKKIEIDVAEQGKISVRPKDVMLLHPGPVASLNALHATAGDVLTAWELLAGETTTLPELAELAYGEFSPAAAWAAWRLVADGLYFDGTPEEIRVRTGTEV